MKLCAGLILSLLVIALTRNVPTCASDTVPDSRLANFLWLMSGNFTDRPEVSDDLKSKESKVHTLYYVLYKPVKVAVFASSPTFLVKETVKNQLVRLLIFAVSMDPDGIIRLKPYTIANGGKYTFETPVSEIVAGLKEGDLKPERSECDVTYAEVEPNVFFGSFPDCLDYRNTNPQSYAALLTCNFFSAIVPPEATEVASPRPYKSSLITRFSLAPFSDILGDARSAKDPCACS